MKIGYPCINRSIGCTSNTTFRLASYSDDLFKEKVANNLKCLLKILEYNVEHNFLFFRIGSEIIPFASHPVCKFDWKKYFKKELLEIGNYIKQKKLRVSMHPDQFVLINSPNTDIVTRSVDELKYHADFLDALGVDYSAKIQIHVGGAYGDKKTAISRFILNYNNLLPDNVKKRLVVENDDRLFSLKDCLYISSKVKVPILLDVFHHECLNNKEAVEESLFAASKTWLKKDGVLIVDYSSQEMGERKGKHAETLDSKDFKEFLSLVWKSKVECDVMLEIKDKENSAGIALKLL